ncbi:3-deoxy-D-manno-oct-2-ulosonate III transferase WaaZ, partial [Obesumbacterium proteus]|nr:3-deoxy-D-manno-oct-2-ulosonate III transferase WaaZ [Obesumbacterium proteus]
DLGKILPFFQFMRDNVTDINIYNLSNNTAIDYNVIPYIEADE